MSFQLTDINSNWTLFLDRDGVINVERNEDYVKNWDESYCPSHTCKKV